MSGCHQLQLGVEDAEQLVTAEIELGDIAADLLVDGRIAEAQIAVVIGQRQQMLLDQRQLLGVQAADQRPGRGGTFGFSHAPDIRVLPLAPT